MVRGRPRKYFNAIDLFLASYIRDELGIKQFDMGDVKWLLEGSQCERQQCYRDDIDTDYFYCRLGYGKGMWLPDLGENGWEVVWND